MTIIGLAGLIRMPLTTNRYVYAMSNPIRNVDPTGQNPLNSPHLREMIDTILRREVQQLRDAIFVPLGDAVSSVFEYLRVEDRRVLYGLPHPSGANRERINYFLDKKPRHLLSSRTNPVKIDAAKQRLQAKVVELLSAASMS